MERQRDNKTGIIRHTYGTVNPRLCRQYIEESGEVNDRMEQSGAVIYDFGENHVNIVSTETRTAFVGMSDKELLEAFSRVGGTEWEYDNQNKFDFAPATVNGKRI